jgi:anhydro-N-acetylmuramic acid kinase
VDALLGTFTGRALAAFLRDHGILPERIRAIGSHGQTIRHRPEANQPFTWQIGDPNRIAEVTGITTVADFRRRDMAAGGQGAPLVPAFHEALFRTENESRVLLNIGGISNITCLSADPCIPVSGFDTGPGNGLMDAWCLRHRGLPYDANGDWAATGQLVSDLLATLMTEPYLHKTPPKSTGREMFHLSWLESQQALDAFRPQDVQRTLVEFTAATIIDAVKRWAPESTRLVVCGGGRLNGLLMGRLEHLADMAVQTSDDLGFDGDAMEAAAFAWLAARRLDGLSGNAPAVTGALGSRILGAVYPGAGD